MEIFNAPLELIGLLAIVALGVNIALGLKDKVKQPKKSKAKIAKEELRKLEREIKELEELKVIEAKKAELEDKLESLKQEVDYEQDAEYRTIL